MKKQILTIAFICQGILCFSQSLVTTNKSWSNLKVDFAFQFSTENIKFASDTLLNGRTYKKAERSIDQNHLNWSIYGFIREDSSKKVFYKMNVSQPERLFYDFDLNVNDTITAYSLLTWGINNTEIQSQFYHVLSIDSILIGETYRKQINLSFPGDTVYSFEHWIDSTGNTGGILHNSVQLVGQDSYSLLCFTEDGIVKYHNLYFDSCWVVSGINEYNFKDLTINVFPNPLSKPDFLTVDAKGTAEDIQIDFFDLLGTNILSKCFRKEIKLNMSYFPTGIYFYKVHNQINQTVSGKLLIK